MGGAWGSAGHRESGPVGWRPAGTAHRPEFATLIVNPNAGGGRVGRELPAVEEAMSRHGLGYRVLAPPRPEDIEVIAREALGRGERFLVAVGGDGTANRVVNGMLEDDRPVEPEAVLGIVAAHSGCD